MEAAIRFNQNSHPGLDQQFLKVDVAGKSFQLSKITSIRSGKVSHKLICSYNKLSNFRAFDWHPTEASLVALGQTGGEASIVNLADKQSDPISFPARSQRPCNSVALNSKNWLAVGLDKVRADSCLNVFDINQRMPAAAKASSGRSQNTPLHGLASGDPITSLKFWHDQPHLLAAGVKNHFIRVYDLRDSSSTPVLQFATRCVNNLAIDYMDENYFASCFPSQNTAIAMWDRRMVSRTNVAHIGFERPVQQSHRQPEACLEFPEVIDQPGTIWALRFAKTTRGCLGALSNSGQVRVYQFGKDAVQSYGGQMVEEWDKQRPGGVFLERARDAYSAYYNPGALHEMNRVVSFDFTTENTKLGQPKMIVLTLDGEVKMHSLTPTPEPLNEFITSSEEEPHIESRRTSASRSATVVDTDMVKMKISPLRFIKQRCLSGYLLNASRNSMIVADDPLLKYFWTWVEHARSIADQNIMVQDNLDLSFLGIYNIWTETVSASKRIHKSSSPPAPNIGETIKALARRLNLSRGRGCPTDFPSHRALGLYISGLPWTYDAINRACDALVAKNEHTEAAAMAVFAGEEKLAQKALRAKGMSPSHKLLAMALAGSRHRDAREHNEEWAETIASVSEDLTDPFARAILSFVKTGSWDDVLKDKALPLIYRLNIALRHLDDTKLTTFIKATTTTIIKKGDLHGISLTGLGTTQGTELLASYVRSTNDIQTTALALHYGGLGDCFIAPSSIHGRIIASMKNTYKSQLMSLNLKFEKAKFDVAVSRAIRANPSGRHDPQIRPKEQVRLVCSHCTQPLSIFGHDQHVDDSHVSMVDTPRNPFAPDRTALVGTICPKCGRHLPRCGVCDLWLGTPDESYSKYYKPPPARLSTSMDMGASMVGSTITAFGPASAPVIKVSDELNALTSAKLPEVAVEDVDEDMAERERKWVEVMHRFIVFCVKCSHGFHSEHAKQWFGGGFGQEGSKTCPVPRCECACSR